MLCSCPSSFLLKGTAYLTRVTRLNGDEGGFKLTGQALNCGVEKLARGSTCCPCSREGRTLITYIAVVNVARWQVADFVSNGFVF